jgi:uncharacterized protein
MDSKHAKIQKLKDYLEKRDDVVMAFLFGSQAKGYARATSDWDIGVYFKSKSVELEVEDIHSDYPQEDSVWGDLTEIVATDSVDLIVLNKAPASLAGSVLRGLELVNKDRALWTRYMLIVTGLAEDYQMFADDYHRIVARSASLSPADKERLARLLDFLKEQASLYGEYQDIPQKEFEDNPRYRNEVERWLENIVNCSIDIAKIMLGSNKRLIPPTYRETMRRAMREADLPEDSEQKFDKWVRLRKYLAHEYLDVKWKRIVQFAHESESYVLAFSEAAEKLLTKQDGQATS